MNELIPHLQFDGYWRIKNAAGLPAKSGVYCVYACTYNAIFDTVEVKRLLYVGESGDVLTRVQGHNCWPEWYSELTFGEELCFTAALIAPATRVRTEAALINHHQPPCNKEFKDGFPFPTTTVLTSGANLCLSPILTVSEATNFQRLFAKVLLARR
jgi:hypothetical protein